MKKNLSPLLGLLVTGLLVFFACQKRTADPATGEPLLETSASANAALAAALTPIQVYGVWHAGSDYCTWATARDITEFDQKNHWLIDRGNGQPSVNLVILSFVNPLKLLNKTPNNEILQQLLHSSSSLLCHFLGSYSVR